MPSGYDRRSTQLTDKVFEDGLLGNLCQSLWARDETASTGDIIWVFRCERLRHEGRDGHVRGQIVGRVICRQFDR
jgi:hypothetical protein